MPFTHIAIAVLGVLAVAIGNPQSSSTPTYASDEVFGLKSDKIGETLEEFKAHNQRDLDLIDENRQGNGRFFTFITRSVLGTNLWTNTALILLRTKLAWTFNWLPKTKNTMYSAQWL